MSNVNIAEDLFSISPLHISRVTAFSFSALPGRPVKKEKKPFHDLFII